MKPSRLGLGIVLAALATFAAGQGTAELPQRLAGRWTATGPSGIFTDSFSIVFEGERRPGKVAGRLTWRGFNCGAKDEPIQADWDGVQLGFTALLRADTNTQRSYGNCGTEPGRWVLKRSEAGTFEGEGRFGAAVVSMTAKP